VAEEKSTDEDLLFCGYGFSKKKYSASSAVAAALEREGRKIKRLAEFDAIRERLKNEKNSKLTKCDEHRRNHHNETPVQTAGHANEGCAKKVSSRSKEFDRLAAGMLTLDSAAVNPDIGKIGKGKELHSGKAKKSALSQTLPENTGSYSTRVPRVEVISNSSVTNLSDKKGVRTNTLTRSQSDTLTHKYTESKELNVNEGVNTGHARRCNTEIGGFKDTTKINSQTDTNVKSRRTDNVKTESQNTGTNTQKHITTKTDGKSSQIYEAEKHKHHYTHKIKEAVNTEQINHHTKECRVEMERLLGASKPIEKLQQNNEHPKKHCSGAILEDAAHKSYTSLCETLSPRPSIFSWQINAVF